MNNELIGELLQGLTDDVTSIKKRLTTQPQPLDYQPTIEKLTVSILNLQKMVAQSAAAPPASPTSAVDLKALEQALRQAVATEVRRNNPDYRVSQGVIIGMVVLAVSVCLNGIMGWYLQTAQQARDRYQGSDWVYRGFRQAYPRQATSVLTMYQQDAATFQKRVVELERADSIALRAAAFSQEARALEARAKAVKKGQSN